MSEPATAELRKAAKKNRGKESKAKNVLWIDAIEEIVRTNPCGGILVEGADGKPRPGTRPFTKRNAWVIELMGKDGKWGFAIYFNLDKNGSTFSFSHTVKWAMAKLQQDKEYFQKDPQRFDKCLTRIRNLVTDDVIMAAILI